MQNILGGASTVAPDGMLYMPWKDGRARMVDVRDILDVAATALTADGHESQTYTLTGATSASFHDVSAALSKALDKDVTYVDVPVEAAVQAMVDMGFSEFMAKTVGELHVNFAANGANCTTKDVEAVTGHTARSIDDFARDFAGIFGGC